MKAARRLKRRPDRTERLRFLAEGPLAVAEALGTPGCVEEVFATTTAHERYADLRTAAPGWTLVSDAALSAIADTVHPQGLVAVCHFIDRPLEKVLPGPGSAPSPRLVAICAEVRDPGNAGTVIRTADAAGADAVVLAGESVDPYNPKTVRATVGSLFHLPLARAVDPAAAVRAARSTGLTVLAADGAGELDLDTAIDDGLLGAPSAWLFGNEAWGLPAALADLADHRVRIPLHGRAESLNLSAAAAVCLYASARAHRRPG